MVNPLYLLTHAPYPQVMSNYMPPATAELHEAWRAGAVAEVIERGLAPLIGMPFRYVGRAADLVWVGFGPDTSSRDLKGQDRTLAKYALHLQCPFRLDGPTGTLVAAHDLYHSAESPLNDSDEFDPDVIGTTWFDARVGALAAPADDPRVVQRVRADRYGGFELTIADLALRVFPATSFQREHWRFFEAGADGEHFVVFQDPSL